MPPHIIGMYSTMLPRIEASERLDRISDLLAVEGRMLEDHARQRYMGELASQVRGGRRARRATRKDLAGMRVKVIEEPARKRPRKKDQGTAR